MFALSAVLALPTYFGVPIVCNFMRGRDASTNKYRELHREVAASSGADFLKGMLLGLGSRYMNTLSMCEPDKNRASMFIYLQAVSFAKLVQRIHPSLALRAIEASIRYMRPSFISYKSGSLVFDSVVFTPVSLGFLAVYGCDGASVEDDVREIVGRSRPTANRISATLAVRTRRTVA